MPTTILLDEPEFGLHPAAIQLLINLLQSAATRTQVIVSTQSVTLINQLKQESFIIVDRKEEQSTFRKLTHEELDEWVEDYGLGDMWEKKYYRRSPLKKNIWGWKEFNTSLKGKPKKSFVKDIMNPIFDTKGLFLTPDYY